MSSSASVRAVAAALGAVAGLFLLQCSSKPPVLGPSDTGGSSARGGSGGAAPYATGGATGGNVGDPDASVLIKLDTIPAWWVEKDAPQEPDIPPAPNFDANCGLYGSETTRESVDVLLVLDRSASMDYSIKSDCYCTTNTTYGGNLCPDTTDCTTRWNAIKPAVQTTLSSSQYVEWGLKFFSTPKSANCGVASGVEVGIGPDSADEISKTIDKTDLSLSTPTAAGIRAATAYLKTLTDTRKKFILLATDGEPNCGANTPDGGGGFGWATSDVEGAADAAEEAQAAGFPVYVVGIGPNLGNLTTLAKAGGTKDYYPVESPDQLAQALSSIGKAVGSCTFQAKDPPKDPDNVAVYVNKQLIEKNPDNGWKYGATNQDIELTGSYCEHITAGESTAVQILFGCPGAPPFPTYIP